MDNLSSFSAPHIFHSLAQSKEYTEETQAKLKELGEFSTHLFQLLDQAEIDKDEVLHNICNIASHWRSLMRADHAAIRSDVHRLKLYHAFENVLDQVKGAIAHKQNEAQEQRNRSGKNQVISTAAATVNSLREIFYSDDIDHDEDETREWMSGLSNQLTSYFNSLSNGKERQSATFEDILKGIEQWEKFVKEEHESQETDIRILHLKQEVAEQLNDSSPTQTLSLQEKREMQQFLKEVEAQHEKLLHQLETNRHSFVGEEKDIFAEFLDAYAERYYYFGENIQKLYTIIDTQTQETIGTIQQRVLEGPQTIQQQSTMAIANLQAKAKELKNLIQEKANQYYLSQVEQKNHSLVEWAENNLSPESVLKDPNSTYTQLIYHLLSADSSFLSVITQPVISHLLLDNLRNNLSTLLENQSLQRLGVVFIKVIINALVALHDLKESSTKEEILQLLQRAEVQNPMGGINKEWKKSHDLNFEGYKQKVHDDLGRVLSFLLIKLPSQIAITPSSTDNLSKTAREALLMGEEMGSLESTSSSRSSPILFRSEVDEEMRESPILRSESSITEELYFEKSISSPSPINDERNMKDKENWGKVMSLFRSRTVESVESSFSQSSSFSTDSSQSGTRIRKSSLSSWLFSTEKKIKSSMIKPFVDGIIDTTLPQLEESLSQSIEKIVDRQMHTLYSDQKENEVATPEIMIENILDSLSKNGMRMFIESNKWEVLLRNMGHHSDVVLIYLLDKIGHEIQSILDGEELDPSETGGKAIFAFREAIYNFKKSPAFAESLKPFDPIILLMPLIESQGNPHNLVDVTGPIVTSILPRWRAWLDS